MDDRQLEKILKDIEVPAPEGNAKKRAVNLALVEFDKHQKEKTEKRQGFSLFGRLTDSSDKNARRTVMQKRLVYGGMATAMVVVLATTLSMEMVTHSPGGGKGSLSEFAHNIVASPSWFGVKQQQTFSMVTRAPDMKVAPGRENVSQTYAKAVEEQNKQRVEKAISNGASALPAPVSTPVGRLASNEMNRPTDDGRIAGREQEMASADAAAPKASVPMGKLNAGEDPIERWRHIPQQEPAKKAEMRSRADVVGQAAGGVTYEADRLMRQKMPETKAAAAPPASVAIAPGIIAPQPPIVMNDEEIGQNYYKDVGRDKFEHVEDNPPKAVSAEPVSTFSLDVDTTSYSFMRRQINEGVLPQKDAVRIEEMVNYFEYDYALPESKEQPFKPTVTVTPSPWKDGNMLMHIAIKGYDIPSTERPHSNLVFLLDTSGSMNSPDKLPLVIQSMKLLLDTLNPDDTVAIVTYAGNAGTALEPTAVRDKSKILSALDSLGAGGSTAGAEGIRQAYALAEAHYDKKSVNRVILATDGDFNVGITNHEELKSYIERKRETGIFLSVLGFGQGNLNDQMMQELAQNGNGVAAYIDNLNEARKVLVKEATSTLFPIAKDVKIQVEFNPATVAEYRLVGYETRHLNREDFNNDKIDAGDVGAGKAVTAIYEITPVGGPRLMDESRYAATGAKEADVRCIGGAPGQRCGGNDESVVAQKVKADANFGSEYAFLKIRYKLPDEDTSHLITTPVDMNHTQLLNGQACPALTACESNKASDDVRFSVAVAGFGQLLKGGKYTGKLTYDDVLSAAQDAKGKDEYGYRSEFIQLVRLAKSAAALQKN